MTSALYKLFTYLLTYENRFKGLCLHEIRTLSIHSTKQLLGNAVFRPLPGPHSMPMTPDFGPLDANTVSG